MLIGLTGLKGSGKDTVADMLVEHYGYTKFGFAELLKESVARLLGITREQIEEYKNDDSVLIALSVTRYVPIVEMNFRVFLQRYGTEAHRDVFGHDFWIKAWGEAVVGSRYLVVPDVRFDNEALAIVDAGGVVYEIDRGFMKFDNHASEQGINSDYISGVIPNRGSIQDLYNAVEEALDL